MTKGAGPFTAFPHIIQLLCEGNARLGASGRFFVGQEKCNFFHKLHTCFLTAPRTADVDQNEGWGLQYECT